jgi:hypothetical protein
VIEGQARNDGKERETGSGGVAACFLLEKISVICVLKKSW